jgi:hypothetical protein
VVSGDSLPGSVDPINLGIHLWDFLDLKVKQCFLICP